MTAETNPDDGVVYVSKKDQVMLTCTKRMYYSKKEMKFASMRCRRETGSRKVKTY